MVNLDGPDGLSDYCNNLRDERRVRMSRQPGDGSVIVRDAFPWYGTSTLVFLTGRQNAEAYCET